MRLRTMPAALTFVWLATEAWAQAPVVTTLDSVGDVGRWSDVVLRADGRGVIAYTDATNATLKVASCDDVACTSAFLSTIDTGGPFQEVSVAIAFPGHPVVAYQHVPTQSVRYAYCNDPSCLTASVVTIEDLTTLVRGTDIAIGVDTYPVIVYAQEGVGDALRVAHCEDLACTSRTVTAHPDTVGAGQNPAIIRGGDGLPVFASQQGLDLRVGHCSDAACTSATFTRLLGFSQLPVQRFYSSPALALGADGRVVVAFVLNEMGIGPNPFWSVRYRRCADASCTSLVEERTIEFFQSRPAIGVAPGDRVFVGHYGAWTTPQPRLKFTRCSDATCSGAPFITIDGPDIGFDHAMALSPMGAALFSYHDDANDDLKVAWVGTPPEISVGDAAVTEGDSGQVLAQVPVTLSGADNATVDFATADGTATAGTDYVATGGTLTFTPGATTQFVAVPVLGDLLPENDETFRLLLANGQGATVVDPEARVTILDNEARLLISNESLLEGDSGTQDLVFTVSLDNQSASVVTVAFATQGLSATSGVDFLPASGSLTFPPGTTARTVTVAVVGDTLVELEEGFQVVLSNAQGALIEDGVGNGGILNDDTARVSVTDQSAAEGDTGAQELLFAVSVDHASATTMTVDFATEEVTATSGVDFMPASGTVTFPPGTTEGMVAVTLNGDYLFEPDETFRVALSNAQGSLIQDPEGIGGILNDDAPEAPLFGELRHGASVAGDLTVNPGPTADTDDFPILQEPYTSYEVVVDAASGETLPIVVERRAAGGAVLQTGEPVGTGAARSLRWRVAGSEPIADQTIRIAGACGTACGPDDAYRARAYDTTLSAARFNNAGTQTTVLIVQNPGPDAVALTIHLWAPDGTLLATHQPAPLVAYGVLVLNTSTVPGAAGVGGSLTVAHDAPYGRLVGKAVAVEPGTGLSFDTPLEPKAY